MGARGRATERTTAKGRTEPVRRFGYAGIVRPLRSFGVPTGRRAALALLLGLLPSAAWAGTFWRRVGRSPAASERELLRAVERLLLGLGDDHDALAAHAALLDYLRGRAFEDPRIEVLLARLRLDTSWSHDRRLEARLEASLGRSLPPDLLGLGWADWGNLAALRGDVAAARVRFDAAVERLWEHGPRASALVGRGWARLAQGDAPGASDDFLEAAATADNLRLVVAALWSGALAHERAGRDDEAMRLRRRAGELERVRASASGRDPFDGVAQVPAYEEHAVAAVQHAYALEVALRSEDFEAAALARRARCDALRLYVVHAEPDRSPWVHRAHDLWARCRDELAAE